MADIVLTGDTSGAITIAAPAVAGTNTLTLPASTGTMITSATAAADVPKPQHYQQHLVQHLATLQGHG